MHSIKEVIFSITSKCNLRCRMCDIPYAEIEELTTQQWKDVIKDASRLGAQTVVFSGGEPLLREDIFELISFTRENNLNACVTSNGQLINESTAQKLSDSGVNVVNISIEGKRETHDHLRGRGSFDRAVCGLTNLRKYKVESTVASTVSKYNYQDLLYVLEVAKDYGATTVRLQPFNIIFLKDHKRKKEFLIDKRDIPFVEEAVKSFINKSKEYKIAINPAGYLLKIPEYLSGKNFYPRNCSALWYSCPINPNGDLFPCWIEGANNKLIGNVKTDSLYKLWLSDKRIRMVNSITNNGCKGCLMSCYDEAFDHKLLKESVVENVKKMKKITNYRKVMNKIAQSLKSQITRLKLRYRFYISYKGSLSALAARRLRSAFSRGRILKEGKQIEREFVLSEINQAKRKFKKEMRGL
jgi:radical SAM protein with 4Fe4S-binding SPASM domain